MNAKALLIWTGVSLGAHLALFALWPTLRPPPGTAGKALPVHLVAPRPAVPSPPNTLPPAAAPSAGPAATSPRPVPAPPHLPDRSPLIPTPTIGPTPALSPPPPSGPAERDSASPMEPSGTPAAAPAAALAPKGHAPEPADAAVARPSEKPPKAAVLPVETAAPLYEHNPPPHYPRQAQERGWEGDVLLRVRVSVSGEVEGVTVEQSSGRAVLDRAAREAVQRWRFRPGRHGGMPVKSEVVVPIYYRLEGS